MPRDLLPGTTVLAQDTPPTVQGRDTETITGLDNTSYSSIGDQVGVTFTAPTTGRVKITIHAGMRANGNSRAQATVEVREGDASGAIVMSTSGNPMWGSSSDESSYIYGDGSRLVENLTPGATYFARVMTRQSSSSGDHDISERTIIVEPMS